MKKTIYRQSTTVEIGGCELEFYPLGISQTGLVMEMIILGLKDSFLTPAEIKDASFDSLLQKCIAKIAEIEELPEGQDKNIRRGGVPGLILTKSASSDVFHQLVKQSFPGIDTPGLLTDDAKLDIINILLRTLTDRLLEANDIIKQINSLV